jgi:predicted Zn finger-like uncharacterized protein
MSTTTQCPECGTRFKATQAQLEAFHGMVRCGHCHAAFNAIEHRNSREPGPQLDLPIMLEEPLPPETAVREAPQAPEHRQEGRADSREGEVAALLWQTDESKAPGRAWPWAVASVLLVLLLLGQAAYLFRVDLAARLPGLKPALLAACGALHCDVPLPGNIEQMDIESSNLETDPAQPGVITLSLTLRNLAPYAQEYPNLELTLTDFNEVPAGRRVFRPAEYLKDAADEKNGLAGKRENSIRLAIDASGLSPVGYRLFLFY